MPFIVVYDANVLYPNSLRDLLIRVAQAGLVQAKWTDQILDETFRNLRIDRPDLDPAKLDRTRTLMNRAIRDVRVTGYEPLIGTVDLPDPDDRHVVAAAIKSHAQVIVTENTKHFPPAALTPWNLETRNADEFVHDLIDLNRQEVYAQIQRMADAWIRPSTVEDVLNALEHLGLLESVTALRS
ncbi:PIN domain-containing protein [Kribbella sp. NPDC051770]|uniref:PIN domain-containing protein n=1 Tax=Kribbella sp. NPDC051770 TaxID=3155413 RepID=UPI00341D8678